MISPEKKLIITDQNEEVKKLQNLVKKLELQNVELRRKRSVNEYNEEQQKSDQKTNKIVNISPKCDEFQKRGNISLESVDLIDVDELEELSDEDTWLFSPPRELTPEQKKLSPYSWLRRDIDDPNDIEIQSIRKALVDRLDEIVRRVYEMMKDFNEAMYQYAKIHSEETISLQFQMGASPKIVPEEDEDPTISPFTTPNAALSQSPAYIGEQSRYSEEIKINNVPPRLSGLNQAPSLENSVPDVKAQLSSRAVDTRTFTRPKKRKELFPTEKVNYNNLSYNHDGDSPVERLQDEETPSEFDDLCSIESSMTASGLYKFHGVKEVQELARRQEESKYSCPIKWGGGTIPQHAMQPNVRQRSENGKMSAKSKENCWVNAVRVWQVAARYRFAIKFITYLFSKTQFRGRQFRKSSIQHSTWSSDTQHKSSLSDHFRGFFFIKFIKTTWFFSDLSKLFPTNQLSSYIHAIIFLANISLGHPLHVPQEISESDEILNILKEFGDTG
ncbi:SLAIN motif-containing protein 2 [Nymphon striatum]|nr:SLAIN motif-containing protein 2 [Nymphon striatum]